MMAGMAAVNGKATTARWDHGRKDEAAHAPPGAAWRGDARRAGGREGGVSERRLRAGRRSGDQGGKARLHRLDRRGAALRRQGEGPLRQAWHARRRGPEAGLVGHDARQPRARLRGQWHRRRPHPHADALPHQRRQGDAEQRADADAHLARLNLNGQCISVAKEYADIKVGLDTKPFREALQKKKAAGKAIKAAMTFPGGTHDLWIRYWLAAGGVDPDKDIETIVVPPPQMVANMKVGTMDCFCVCEPWNLQLIHQNIGYTAITTGELWERHPEKSFGLRAAYVDRYPKATKALLMAVMEAQQWCERLENAAEVAAICAKRQWINCPVEDITDRVKGKFDYGTGRLVENSPHVMRYWADHASYPFQSHDLWFITEDIRWGKFEANVDAKALIAKVNREDLWREAAKELGVAAGEVPASTSRGKETFFDGKVFDPDDPTAYLAALDIKRVA